MKRAVEFLCLLIGLKSVHCANILVLDTLPSPSHHLWMKVVNLELVKRGHNVTSLSTLIEKDVPENLHYLHLDRIFDPLLDEKNAFDFFELGKDSAFKQMYNLADIFEKFINSTTASSGYKQLLNYPDDFNFDLILYDFGMPPIVLPFSTKFKKTPVIGISAMSRIFELEMYTGVPFFSSFVPSMFQIEMENGFLDRLKNTILNFSEHFLKKWKLHRKIENDLKKDFPDFESLDGLGKRVKISLINHHPVVDFLQPMSPDIIPIAGLHIKDPKPLPTELEEIFEKSKKGVVYFSLGTNLKSEFMSKTRINEFLKAFKEIPDYNFLWKIDTKGLDLEIPENVYVRKWLPQNDVLGHPKTKLFITHGGIMSVQESIWFGVPLLGIPFFMDQKQNIDLAKKYGTAEKIEMEEVESSVLKKKLLLILKNPSYSENAQLRSRNFKDQPEKPMDRAMWWIEYVLRNPNIKFLKSKSLELNVFQRESLDVHLAIFLIVLFIAYLAKCFLMLIFKVVNLNRSAKIKTN